VRVLIASYLEPHLVDRIRGVDTRLEVTYRPDLLGQPRYPGDHTAPMQRTTAQDQEWAALVAEAEILFDIYRPQSDDLPRRAPRLRWIQFSSSGVGTFVEEMGLAPTAILVTNAAGVHATPLAEFVLFAILYFAKQMPRVLSDQRRHHWEQFAVRNVRGATLGLVGLGGVGREIARLATAVGMRVVAIRRSDGRVGADVPDVEAVYPTDGLRELLAESDYVTLILPHTRQTAGLIGKAELGAMKPGAVLINIARGTIVDEPALIEALRSGHLGGAALDVFAIEPLPAASPLWDMPNVLITPHTISTAIDENELVVDLFCDNLRRFLAGEPLRNLFDRARGY
jgi:phosphoglycerate dehydrogenase-like enzyme